MTLIPGVETVHPRHTWEDPNLPINDPPTYTPPPQNWTLITAGVAHYTAADNLIDGDPGEHANNLPAYLRNIQRAYRNDPTRRYSIGYLWAVDWLGGAWELRGWDYRAAANLGTLADRRANYWTIPVLYLVDGADPLTDEAANTARLIYWEAGRRAGRDLGRPLPHHALDATGCPGAGITAQIHAGILDPLPPPPPEPPEVIEPPDEETDMLEYVLVPKGVGTQPWWPWLACYTNGAVRPLGPTQVTVPFIDVADTGQYRRICAAANIQLVTELP